MYTTPCYAISHSEALTYTVKPKALPPPSSPRKRASALPHNSLFVNKSLSGFAINKIFSKCSSFVHFISMICLFVSSTIFDLRGRFVNSCQILLKFVKPPFSHQKVLKTVLKSGASPEKSVESSVENVENSPIFGGFPRLLKKFPQPQFCSKTPKCIKFGQFRGRKPVNKL